jgi:hypothetical protein
MHSPNTDLLPRIKERYRTMYALTKDACDNPEPDAIAHLLDKREELFKEIDTDAARMQGQKGPREADPKVLREIESMIQSMQECDILLRHVLENNRDEIAARLCSLNSSARAALKYTRQSSIDFQRRR